MRRREIITFFAGAAFWPITGRAEQNGLSVIGFLHFGSPKPFTYQTAAFEQGLKESGYVQGQNLAIEYRWAEGRYDRLPVGEEVGGGGGGERGTGGSGKENASSQTCPGEMGLLLASLGLCNRMGSVSSPYVVPSDCCFPRIGVLPGW